MLDLVFIWLKEHSLIVLLLLGTIFNVFWLYRMRRQLQMKWYAVIAFSVLHTVCGVLSVKAFAFLETGDAGNMSLFGGVFFMPVLYFISAKVSKRNIKAVFDIFTICMIFTVMCARVNCIVSGCCAGLVIPGTHVHFPTRELEILYYIVMLILLIPRVKKSKNPGSIHLLRRSAFHGPLFSQQSLIPFIRRSCRVFRKTACAMSGRTGSSTQLFFMCPCSYPQ